MMSRSRNTPVRQNVEYSDARAVAGAAMERDAMADQKQIRSFREFYPFCLSEHANRTWRRLHFLGTRIAGVLLVATLVTPFRWLAAVAILQGHAFAWVGHCSSRHNKCATFNDPAFSLMGDSRLWREMLTGRTRVRIFFP
jgi:hypothetical protein